jgi:hypothetical protein
MSAHLIPDHNDESFAAELTSAAYPVFLENGLAGSWVEFELRLWKVLAETVETWRRAFPRREVPEAYNSWRSGLIAQLTDWTMFVAREQHAREPLRQLRPGLFDAFSSAISHACSEPTPNFIGVSPS